MLRTLLGLLLLANTTTIDGQNFALSPQHFDQTSLLDISPVPHLQAGYLAPNIQASAALIVDNATGITLYGKNSREVLPMASLTKIMTAVLILEHHNPNEIVTIESDFKNLEGVKIWLHQNEQMTVENLLKALLIPSAGDAAIALAEFHSGSVEAFVEAMNERAKELHLTKTQFKNPVGLDEEGHYSSAHDLIILARHAMQIPLFRNIVRLSSANIESADGRFSYSFDSTNYLLGSYLNILGVKTGTTDAAGQSLINLARDERGNEVLAVVLNSPERFQENKSMIDWAFRAYKW